MSSIIARVLSILGLCVAPSLASAQTLQPVQILHEFATPAYWPNGGLVQVPDGSFYGVAINAIYRVATDGTVTIAATLDEGLFAAGRLTPGPGGVLFGVTTFGGVGQGTVFRFDPATAEVRTLHTFETFSHGEPIGGLVLAGGFLFGASRFEIFKVDPATGATTSEIRFEPSTIGDATSPLTIGADGLLYGTARFSVNPPSSTGALYRFDPATRTLEVLHAFAPEAYPNGPLTLGPDGRLYGGTVYGPAGSVYRYNPVTDIFETLSAVTGGAGAVLLTPDGNIYGTTFTSINTEPNPISSLFRLVPSGGGYTLETLTSFNRTTIGLSDRAELLLGTDGLIYGYSQFGGATDTGTIWRFDPESPGGPNVPLTLLHTFPASPSGPSTPTPGGSGVLYGTTSRGGAAQRGVIYAVDADTGAVTIPASIPGTPAVATNGWTTPLTLGSDLTLWGTSAVQTATGVEHALVHVVPTQGTTPPVATVTTANVVPATSSQMPIADTPLARAPSGDLFFVRGLSVMRFVPGSGTLTSIGQLPTTPAGSSNVGTTTVTRPVFAADGHIYLVTRTVYVIPYIISERTLRLFRINTGTNVLEEAAVLGRDGAFGTLAAGADGMLYLGGGSGNGSEIQRIDPATGARQVACTFTDNGLNHLAALPDGRLVGFTAYHRPHRLLICTPATGASEARVLPAGIGELREPLQARSGLLYGATWDGSIQLRVPFNFPRRVQPGGALIRLSLDAAPPALDTDSDGLPSEWETRYGLDAFASTGGDGASGDPDGDGQTNAQELAVGTHPRGTTRRYFAEGATGPFFRTRLDLVNPNPTSSATVQLRFLNDNGLTLTRDVVLADSSRLSIDPSTLPGFANTSFSTVVEADATIAVDRTMAWDPSGYGSHLETGVTAPATTWFFAEGSTSGPFALFYLLQNPNPTPVDALVRYLRPGQAPTQRVYALPPFSRTTIVVDADVADADVSAVITAPQPIVAERAMYYSQPGGPAFGAGHESAGITSAATEWFLAEGATGAFFDLFVLIANPSPTPATVEVEYLLVGGGSLTKTYTVPGESRFTIWVDDEQLPAGSGQRPLADASMSMAVRSTNHVPIVVERTMWWPSPQLTSNFWYEAHNSPGATATATRWVVAGGERGGDAAAQTYLLIANPSATAGAARVYMLRENRRELIALWRLGSNGEAIGPHVVLPAKSRTSIPFSATGVNSDNGPFSLLIESVDVNGAPVPIVVEHATYSSPNGVTWAAGGNALAAPIP